MTDLSTLAKYTTYATQKMSHSIIQVFGLEKKKFGLFKPKISARVVSKVIDECFYFYCHYVLRSAVERNFFTSGDEVESEVVGALVGEYCLARRRGSDSGDICASLYNTHYKYSQCGSMLTTEPSLSVDSVDSVDSVFSRNCFSMIEKCSSSAGFNDFATLMMINFKTIKPRMDSFLCDALEQVITFQPDSTWFDAKTDPILQLWLEATKQLMDRLIEGVSRGEFPTIYSVGILTTEQTDQIGDLTFQLHHHLIDREITSVLGYPSRDRILNAISGTALGTYVVGRSNLDFQEELIRRQLIDWSSLPFMTREGGGSVLYDYSQQVSEVLFGTSADPSLWSIYMLTSEHYVNTQNSLMQVMTIDDDVG